MEASRVCIQATSAVLFAAVSASVLVAARPAATASATSFGAGMVDEPLGWLLSRMLALANEFCLLALASRPLYPP